MGRFHPGNSQCLFPESPIFSGSQCQTPIFKQSDDWVMDVWDRRDVQRDDILPSTPLVLAGMLVFPPALLYVVNFICIFTSSTIVYYWSGYVGCGEYFHKKYPQRLGQLKHALQERELSVIILWGFFPAVPTDMICYVSETLNIKLWKCLLGVAIGEGMICAIYIFGGGRIFDALL